MYTTFLALANMDGWGIGGLMSIFDWKFSLCGIGRTREMVRNVTIWAKIGGILLLRFPSKRNARNASIALRALRLDGNRALEEMKMCWIDRCIVSDIREASLGGGAVVQQHCSACSGHPPQYVLYTVAETCRPSTWATDDWLAAWTFQELTNCKRPPNDVPTSTILKLQLVCNSAARIVLHQM